MRIETEVDLYARLQRLRDEAQPPGYPASYADAETEDNEIIVPADFPGPPADLVERTRRQIQIQHMMDENPAGTDRLLHDLAHPERLAVTGTLRSQPRKIVVSERYDDDQDGRVGNLLGNVFFFVLAGAVCALVAFLVRVVFFR